MEQEIIVPHHVAIIPDGNRRWARSHKIAAVWEGHREGVKRFQELSDAAFSKGTRFVTFWAASEDNFIKRPKDEVRYFLDLFEEEVVRMLSSDTLEKNGIRVRVIGRWREMIEGQGRTRLIQLIDDLEKKTKGYSNRFLTILFGYDGRSEMIAAFEDLRRDGRPLTRESVHEALWTRDLPLVDLVIRTGGEPHWSAGFMMWHTADSQFYFSDILFPDFGVPDLEDALADYASRDRRFGK